MPVLAHTMRTLLHIFLLCSVLLLTACAGGPSSPYPAPESLQQAPKLRQEFVEAYLQGRWCEARAIFARTIDSFLRQDAFCEVSYTYRLARSLKQFVGEDDPALGEAAEDFARLGLGCSSHTPPLARDARYTALLDKGDYDALLAALDTEVDALYASVYARRAAMQLLDDGLAGRARQFLQHARDTDARQVWVVFLVQDWQLTAQVATRQGDTQAAQNMLERANTLSELIIPCN